MPAFGRTQLALCLLLCAFGCEERVAQKPTLDGEPEAKKVQSSKPRYTVGKETTYVDGPVDKDGYIDYIAALNERLRRGATPENNAAFLIWKALGPKPEFSRMPDEFFQLLGVELPDHGDYFIDCRRYAFKNNAPLDETRLEDQMNIARQRAWTEKEHPRLVAWLQTNQKPLQLVVESTQRTHYFSPLVPPPEDRKTAGFLQARLDGVTKCREVGNALVTRAMLYLSQGDIKEAWNNLLACHRLGRLVGSGATLIEGMAGIAIEDIAFQADQSVLASGMLDAKQIEKCLNDLQNLPPLPTMADKVQLFERFMMLEVVTMVNRHGFRYLEQMSGKRPKESNEFVDALLANADWDTALRKVNAWYDRMAAALREKDRTIRLERLDEIKRDLIQLRTKKDRLSELADAKPNEGYSNKAVGEAIGDILISTISPALSRPNDSADRAHQIHDNLLVAFALTWHQREHGSYPKELSGLVPRYLKKLPPDVFSGKPLIYRPNEKGYLLYSVGVNGEDEDGRGPGDQPRGDDLTVRIPLPELPK